MTTVIFDRSRFHKGEPLERLTLKGRQWTGVDIHLTGLLDTGATLCQIPKSYLQQAGYTTTNLPTMQFATASGKATAGRIDVDIYIFSTHWQNHTVLCIDDDGPVLIGRSLLDLALDVFGYQGRMTRRLYFKS
jgi:predicted aspartyl protease